MVKTHLIRRSKGVKLVSYDDTQLNRLARKIAVSSEGVPESAIKEGGLLGKHIEVSDEYAGKFASAVEKARSLLSDESDK